jgi:hypothetical protein
VPDVHGVEPSSSVAAGSVLGSPTFEVIDVVQGSTRCSPSASPADEGQVKVTREPPGSV